MFDLQIELSKLEIIMEDEISVYNSLVDTEEKKVMAIIDTNLQDVNIYCDFQHKQMKRANELREMREKVIDLIVLNKFPHLSDEATLSYIIKRIPLNKTARLSALRFELITLIARLKQLNKLAPKLFEEALTSSTDRHRSPGAVTTCTASCRKHSCFEPPAALCFKPQS